MQIGICAFGITVENLGGISPQISADSVSQMKE